MALIIEYYLVNTPFLLLCAVPCPCRWNSGLFGFKNSSIWNENVAACVLVFIGSRLKLNCPRLSPLQAGDDYVKKRFPHHSHYFPLFSVDLSILYNLFKSESNKAEEWSWGEKNWRKSFYKRLSCVFDYSHPIISKENPRKTLCFRQVSVLIVFLKFG